MEILAAILALALLVAVIIVVSAPLRAAGAAQENGRRGGPAPLRAAGGGRQREGGEADQSGLHATERRTELEVARESKYREIRDAELDYRTGKLSREDFAATDGALRAEAVEILDRLAGLERARLGG